MHLDVETLTDPFRIRCANATDTFQCLVGADEAVLETVNENINDSGFFGTFVLVPVVDGEFIVERPMATILRGQLNGVRSEQACFARVRY